MQTRSVIKRVIMISLWVVIGGGLLSLLLSANSKKKREQCSDFEISIRGVKDNFFITEKNILETLRSVFKGTIRGTPMADFDLSRMESLLEKNNWIRDAELWFDSHNVLHIRVSERLPIARIFTTSGGSFYIDSSLAMMSLSPNVSIRIPVFTGFPEGKKMDRPDSFLLRQVHTLASFIAEDEFWNAQVAQLNITEEKEFEMIPTVGNHIVKLGSVDELDKKFRRLWIFYDQVLSKAGMDKYGGIDVRYRGQVVAMQKGTDEPAVDKGKLKQNIDNLLRTPAMARDKNDVYVRPGKSQDMKTDSILIPPATIPADPNTMKTMIQPDGIKNETPKAIMQRGNDN